MISSTVHPFRSAPRVCDFSSCILPSAVRIARLSMLRVLWSSVCPSRHHPSNIGHHGLDLAGQMILRLFDVKVYVPPPTTFFAPVRLPESSFDGSIAIGRLP